MQCSTNTPSTGCRGAKTVEHRRRSIDADEIDAGPRQRQRDAAGSAAKLEDRPFCGQRDSAPERYVAPPQRARVLPVVERRVLVPAFPALPGAHGSLRLKA